MSLLWKPAPSKCLALSLAWIAQINFLFLSWHKNGNYLSVFELEKTLHKRFLLEIFTSPDFLWRLLFLGLFAGNTLSWFTRFFNRGNGSWPEKWKKTKFSLDIKKYCEILTLNLSTYKFLVSPYFKLGWSSHFRLTLECILFKQPSTSDCDYKELTWRLWPYDSILLLFGRFSHS